MRMNISVPDDLRQRMDAVEDRVNWSALACRAFEQKLGEVASTKRNKTMADVIQRLRASKQWADDKVYQKGLEFGRQWASYAASAEELERLQNSRDPVNDWYFDAEGSSAFSVGEALYFIIQPDEDGSRDGARDFWQEVLEADGFGRTDDERPFNPSFVQGFAVGAVELWEEVSPQL